MSSPAAFLLSSKCLQVVSFAFNLRYTKLFLSGPIGSSGPRPFLHSEENCIAAFPAKPQLALATQFLRKILQNIPDLWKRNASLPFDPNHMLDCVLFISRYCLFFNLAALHLLQSPQRAHIVSGRLCQPPCFFPPLCIWSSHKIRKTKWRPLQREAARTVGDELVISKMSAVMKIGHLQEATQFTVTEVFTFLVTPGVYSVAEAQWAWSTADVITRL